MEIVTNEHDYILSIIYKDIIYTCKYLNIYTFLKVIV